MKKHTMKLAGLFLSMLLLLLIFGLPAWAEDAQQGNAARIGTTEYKTLWEAVDAANAMTGSVTLEILRDITLPPEVDKRVYPIQIKGDLTIQSADPSNPKTILVMENYPRSDCKVGTFQVNGRASLKLEDITIDGGAQRHLNEDKGNRDEYGNYEPSTKDRFIFTGRKAGGSLIRVLDGGSLTMEEGAILQNNWFVGFDDGSEMGGAVYNAGSFTMNGGIIRQNYAGGYGAGVYNYYLGGYGCDQSPTFTMNGGIITENVAQRDGGGVTNLGRVFMNNGQIIKNYNHGVWNNGEFTMKDGAISNNYASSIVSFYKEKDLVGTGGGIVQYGEVVNNKFLSPLFIMEGGSICNNRAGEGAAISIRYDPENTVIIKDGTISGNHSAEKGGAIHVEKGTLIVEGGNLCDNQCNKQYDPRGTDGFGGGCIWVGPEGMLKLSGNPVIEGRVLSLKDDVEIPEGIALHIWDPEKNVFFGNPIEITGKFGPNVKINIGNYLNNDRVRDKSTQSMIIAKGWKKEWGDPADTFVSERGHKISADESGNVVMSMIKAPTQGKEYFIDYEGEWLAFLQEGYRAYVQLESYKKKIRSGSWLGEYAGKKLEIVKKKDGTKTSETTIVLLSRPDKPTGLTAVRETVQGKNDGKIIGLDKNVRYQYRHLDGEWMDVPAGSTEITPGYGTYEFRVKAGEDHFASHLSDKLTLDPITYTLQAQVSGFEAVDYGYEQPAAHVITITSKGNTAAKIESVTAGHPEWYTISGKGTEIAPGAVLETYTIQPKAGLLPDVHSDTITVSYSGNGTATADVSFTVNKLQQAAFVEKPKLKRVTGNSVSLESALPSAETGIAPEYSCDNGLTWQDSPVFTDLDECTTYSFVVRYAENPIYQASNISDVLEVKTLKINYGLSMSAPAFAPVDYGYAQPDAKAITMISTGNTDAEFQKIAVGHPEWFVLSGSASGIIAGETLTACTIQPAAGLFGGTYQDTVTVTYADGKTISANLEFVVERIDQPAPVLDLELDSVGTYRIALRPAAPSAATGAAPQYSKDNGLTWQDSPVFENLKPLTTYTFVVRYGQNQNYNASGIGSGKPLEVKTLDEINLPETGDDSSTALWLTLAAVSLCGAFILWMKHRRRS